MSIVDQHTFIQSIHPFDRLEEAQRDRVVEALDVGYFRTGEVLIHPGQTPDFLYLVVKGRVKESGPDGTVAMYSHQDIFDATILLGRGESGQAKHLFIVDEELICYLLPKDVFFYLCRNQPAFLAYYSEDLTKKLAKRSASQDTRELASFMVARIDEGYVHPPVFVDEGTSIREAAIAMKAKKSTSVLVRRGNEIGIATGTDMRDAVIIRGVAAEKDIGSIATFPLITLEASDFLFNAMLMMTRYGLNRIVITREGEIIGILEQIDLLSFFSNHSHLIALQVERAKNIADLAQASNNAISVVKMLSAKGVRMRDINRLVSELNRKLFRKLYELLAPPELLANSCLLVMGSEGRSEQILKSDQDNAIILRDDFEYPDLPAIAQRFSDALADAGYPPCPGNIMVSNPAWAKSLAAYKKQISDWISHAGSEEILNMAIFADAQAVAGDGELLREAREYLQDALVGYDAYLARFARATLSFDTPLGFFANLVVDKEGHKDELDIKKGGIFAITHGIRSMALQKGITVTNTVERIEALIAARAFDRAFGAELIDALDFLSEIRLRGMLNKYDSGLALDNYVRPADLTKQERDLLRDAFKVVNSFKKLVSYHFHLEKLT